MRQATRLAALVAAGLAVWAVLPSRAQAAATDAAADWADLTAGLAGTSFAWGTSLGVPGIFVLLGPSFPVLLSQDGSHVLQAAARTGAGRVVVFNKEGYFDPCTTNSTYCSGSPGRVLVNSLRWAGGQPVPTSSVTVRVAADNGYSGFRNAFFTNLKAAAAAVGVNIVPPSGLPSHLLTNASVLLANGTAIADVFLTTAYINYTPAQRSVIGAFVSQGGGLVLGGQGWSFSGAIQTYPGNVLVGSGGLNVVQWTPNSGEWYPTTLYESAAPPDTLQYNIDVAANALLGHINGVAPLPPQTLAQAAAVVKSALRSIPFSAITPGSASSTLWASMSSSLAAAVAGRSATWDCVARINASDPLNVVAISYITKGQQELPPAQVTAFPCSSTFPGTPTSSATSTVTVQVNATYAGNFTGAMPKRGGSRWFSTGLWAPAGQVVTLSISPSLAAGLKASGAGALSFHIGSHSDDISNHDLWCRVPYAMVTSRFYFGPHSTSVSAASGAGGLIYINIDYGTILGPISVTAAGVIRAPYFQRGVTTEADWRASIRNFPAPFAELGSAKFTMTVPSKDIRALDNPQAVVDMWDRVLDSMADLAGMTRDRPRDERITLDCDISVGWMHNGYPAMGFQSITADMVSTDYNNTSELRKWGPFHELGHNHQFTAHSLPGTGETTCNLYTIYALEKVMGVPRTARLNSNRATETATYFATGTFATDWNVWTALYTYLQLNEQVVAYNYTAGWAFYSRVFARFSALDGTPAVADDASRIQTWVSETSAISGYNLLPFYRSWKFPVTASTEAAVAALNLPAFPFDPTAPCGIQCTSCCITDGAPVNCSGTWSTWSACSATCDGRQQSSTFSVARQAFNGGLQCEAPDGATRTQVCNWQPCAPAPHTVVATLQPGNGRTWGTWTAFVQCPAGAWAATIRSRVQPSQGSGDDTALNAVGLTCTNATSAVSGSELLPHAGIYGTWNAAQSCPPATHAVGMRMQSEPDQANGDDTASNSVQLQCSDGKATVIGTSTTNWGTWSAWKTCPAGSAICGFKVAVQAKLAKGDNTAMNDIIVQCCPYSTVSHRDWADLTSGVAGSVVEYGSLGVPGIFNLLGGSFPVLIAKDKSHTLAAASRVGPGRAVAFNKEGYFDACGLSDLSKCNAGAGRILINALRWAGGKPVPSGGTRALVRVALDSRGGFGGSFFANLAAAAAAANVTFMPPTGLASALISDPATQLAVGGVNIADVLLTTSYVSNTAAQITAIRSFVAGGGGVVAGGQAWSFSGTIANYPGNLLFSTTGLNVVTWTTGSGEWYPTNVTVTASPPF